MNGITAAFTGHVGKDAEVRTTRAGRPWASFSVCVDSTKDNEAATTWVRVSLFGDTVEELAPRLVRGVEVYCEGRLSVRPWKDAEGRERIGLSLATGTVTVMGQVGRLCRRRRNEKSMMRSRFEMPAEEAHRPPRRLVPCRAGTCLPRLASPGRPRPRQANPRARPLYLLPNFFE
jgi:single-strand DNA-binding protein